MIAQALPTPFDLGQPAAQVLAIVFFLIPGLNATWAIERLAGRTSLGATERLIRAVALSVLIYALASPWLLRVGHRALQHRSIWPWEPIIGFFLRLFVAPVGIGMAWARLRRSHRVRSGVRRLTNIDPSPTSWNYVFSQGRAYLVRAKLRDGERIGGLFGPDSNASLYPEAQDPYLEQAWRLDEDGTLVEPVESTRGMLLRRDDVAVLELLQVTMSAESSDGQER
jgi:hypothetical protein